MRIKNKNFTFERKLPAIAIVFNNKRQVLMLQREEKGHKWHGKWAFPGGGIEFGEHPKEAVIREAKEEVGLDIEILSDRPIVMNHPMPHLNEDIISIVYPAKHIGGEIDVSKDLETAQAKWFNVEEIDINECLPLTRELIMEAIKFIN